METRACNNDTSDRHICHIFSYKMLIIVYRWESKNASFGKTDIELNWYFLNCYDYAGGPIDLLEPSHNVSKYSIL